jgi:hypothetical protein
MRMSKPYYSPEDLYRVMSDCWHADPKMRPSFTELSDKLGETLLEGDKEVKRALLQLFTFYHVNVQKNLFISLHFKKLQCL